MAQRVVLCRIIAQRGIARRPYSSSFSSLQLTATAAGVVRPSSAATSRWIHSTPLVLNDDTKAKKKAAKAAAKAKMAEVAAAAKEGDGEKTKDAPSAAPDDAAAAATTPSEPETESDVPDWQNPLHHNNPDYNGDGKIYAEDFAPGEEIPIVPLPPLDGVGTDGSSTVPASPELQKLADEILQLNMLEMNELVDNIATHFGFEDDGDLMMGAGGGGGAVEEEAVEEVKKTAFDLKLTGFDAKSKIKVIKEVRAMAGLGLKEAKELVEGAPKVVMKGIKMEEAEKLKTKLEALGATIEIS